MFFELGRRCWNHQHLEVAQRERRESIGNVLKWPLIQFQGIWIGRAWTSWWLVPSKPSTSWPKQLRHTQMGGKHSSFRRISWLDRNQITSSIWLWKITHLWIIFHGYVKWPEVRCLRCFPKKYGFTFLIPVAVNSFFTTRSIGTERQREMWRYWQDTKLSFVGAWAFLVAGVGPDEWHPCGPSKFAAGTTWILFIFLYRKWMRMWRMVVIMITTTDSFSSNTFFSRGKSISPVDTSAVNASFLCRNLPPGRSMATSTSSPRRCRDLPPDLPWKSCWSSDPSAAVLEAAPAPWNAEDQRNAEVAMIQNGENAVEMWKTNNSYHSLSSLGILDILCLCLGPRIGWYFFGGSVPKLSYVWQLSTLNWISTRVLGNPFLTPKKGLQYTCCKSRKNRSKRKNKSETKWNIASYVEMVQTCSLPKVDGWTDTTPNSAPVFQPRFLQPVGWNDVWRMSAWAGPWVVCGGFIGPGVEIRPVSVENHPASLWARHFPGKEMLAALQRCTVVPWRAKGFPLWNLTLTLCHYVPQYSNPQELNRTGS